MNHCSVARKMTGFLQRQQCGYECVICSPAISAPRSRSSSTISGFALNTCMPAPADVGRELAAMIDRRVDVEAVADAGVEVVGAVTRRGVHESRAGIERDVIAEDEDAFALEEGVAVAEVLERRALERLHDL
jgi:hypothetical protein